MAKRKVIVYKDPYGKGGYINKTAKWLRQAQMGAESGVTPVTAGIMQQMQGMQPQPQQQQQVNFEDIIVKDIVEMISRGGGSEDVKKAIYAKYEPYQDDYPELSRLLPNLNQLVEGVFAQLGEETREQQNERLQITEETTVENPEQEEEPDDNSASYYNELAESDNDANYMDYTNNNSRSSIVNDMEFNALDDDDEEEEETTQPVTSQQESEYGDASDVRNNWMYKKMGGDVPNKRSFVNKMVRQLKRAQDGQQTPAAGTETKEANTANVKGTETNPTQPASTTTNNTFVNSVRNQAQENFYRQQAEQMYRNMYMNQRPGLFGGGRMARANRRMFGVPFTPPGVTSAKYNFGLFGGLRNADIQFNPLVLMSMFPSMSFPGMYGVNQSGKVVTPGRLVTETIAQEVNNKSTEEVAKATGSEAAAKAADKSNTPSAKTTSSNSSKTASGSSKGLGISLKTAPSSKSRFPQLTPSSITQFNSPVTSIATPTPKPAATITPNTSNTSTGKVNMSGIPLVVPAKPAPAKPIQASVKSEYMDVSDIRNNWLYKQTGGFVDPNRPDLTKFVYGNQVDNMFLSDILQPPVNQSELDYTDSKDVTDPYFRDGGLYKYEGPGPSQVTPGTTTQPGATPPAWKDLNEADYNAKLAEEKKKWEADYAKKQQGSGTGIKASSPAPGYTWEEWNALPEATRTKIGQSLQAQYNQTQQQYYPGGFGSAGPWQPVWGYPQFGGNPYAGYFGGRGMFQTAANLYRPFTRGASTFSPVGDPLQYAATAAAITKAGMLPTGIKYSKERKQDGNWFERNLGFNKDRITTIDYATPAQIAAGLSGQSGTAAGTTGQQDTRGYKYKGMGLSGLRLGANDLIQRIRFGRPLEDDRPYTQQTTIPASSLKEESPYTPVSSITSTQGADIVTGTPGTPVNITPRSALNTTPGAAPSMPTVGAPTTPAAIQAQQRAAAANNITPQRTADIYNNPTTATKGNLTVINAAGEPINIEDADYYDEEIKRYGGDIPRADLGINFSPVSYPANSIVQPGGIGQGKIGPCTEAEVKDPNSPCYDPIYAGQGPRVMEQLPTNAQLKLKENRTGTINYDNISRGLMDAGAVLADIRDYRNERLNKYIPQMTDLARGERSLAYQDYNPGGYDPRTGRDVYQQGFEGVIGKKGGSIKNKKTKAPTGGHKIDISDFQNLIKLAGLNKK